MNPIKKFRAPPALARGGAAIGGTPNPNGKRSGTSDGLFGPRHFDLAPTGIFGPFFRSNLVSPGWRIFLRPADRILIQLWHRQW